MKRLENGLIEGINYIKDEKTGKIDWFKMIPPEYLYINQDKKGQLEKRLNKSFQEIKKEEALETELIINLAGIRWLLDIIGFKYSKITPNACSQDYAAATCEISFIPSEYNNNQEQIYTQSASAHAGNTKSWYKEYLVEAASNRAFCRAVRFYCNLSCVSAEELGASIENGQNEQDNTPKIAPAKQIQMLKDLMESKKVSWNHIVDRLKKEDKFDEKFTSVDKLPPDVIFELIERLKSIKT